MDEFRVILCRDQRYRVMNGHNRGTWEGKVKREVHVRIGNIRARFLSFVPLTAESRVALSAIVRVAIFTTTVSVSGFVQSLSRSLSASSARSTVNPRSKSCS